MEYLVQVKVSGLVQVQVQAEDEEEGNEASGWGPWSAWRGCLVLGGDGV